jgi:hypothetical protein
MPSRVQRRRNSRGMTRALRCGRQPGRPSAGGGIPGAAASGHRGRAVSTESETVTPDRRPEVRARSWPTLAEVTAADGAGEMLRRSHDDGAMPLRGSRRNSSFNQPQRPRSGVALAALPRSLDDPQQTYTVCVGRVSGFFKPARGATGRLRQSTPVSATPVDPRLGQAVRPAGRPVNRLGGAGHVVSAIERRQRQASLQSSVTLSA